MVWRKDNNRSHSDADAKRGWRIGDRFPVLEKSIPFQLNGRLALTRATSVSWTRAALPSRRLRFALFADNK